MSQAKKILFLCPYPQNTAPSQRLKYEQYFNSFEQDGFQLSVSPFIVMPFWNILYKKGYWFQKVFYTIIGYFRRIYDLFRIRRYDIVYVHLWVTPLGFHLFEMMVCLLAKKVVYDMDDMIFLGHASYANKPLKFLKGKIKIIYLLKKADFVITSTTALEDFAKEFNNHVIDIPTSIDVNKYKPKENYNIQKTMVLGYSGSHSTLKYLKSIEPVFEQLLQRGVDFKVLVVSNSSFSFSNKNIPTEVRYWSLADEQHLLHQMDVGLYPLTDEPWVYGKRGGKALLYMAVGLPIIATAIGSNLDTFDDGLNGFLIPVGNNEGWVNRIMELKDNLSLRQSLGQHARKTIEERFSVEANKEWYLKVLNGVLHDKNS